MSVDTGDSRLVRVSDLVKSFVDDDVGRQIRKGFTVLPIPRSEEDRGRVSELDRKYTRWTDENVYLWTTCSVPGTK